MQTIKILKQVNILKGKFLLDWVWRQQIMSFVADSGKDLQSFIVQSLIDIVPKTPVKIQKLGRKKSCC